MKKGLVLAFGLLIIIYIIMASRKNLTKLLLIILPFSIESKYGQLNTYLIIGICGYFLALDMFKGIKKSSLSGPVQVFIVLFIMANGLSFLFNLEYLRFDEGIFQSPHVQAVFILISCIILFIFIAGQVDSEETLYEFIGVMVLSYLLSSVFAFIQIIRPSYMLYFEMLLPYQDIADSADRGVRVYGTLGGYELFAEYSAIVFLSSCCMALISHGNIKKMFWIGAMLTSIFLLFMTKSRGPIVSLSICASYLIIFHNRTLGVKNILLFLLGCVVSISLAYLAFKDSKYNIIDALLKTNVNISSGKFDSRSEVWKYGYDYFLSMDLVNKVLGVGPGIVSHTPLLLTFPHNLFLYLLISLGLFGAFLYFSWFIWVGFVSQGKIRQDKATQIVTAFIKAIVIFFVIDQMKIEYIRVSSYQQIVWAFMALIYVQVHILSIDSPKQRLI